MQTKHSLIALTSLFCTSIAFANEGNIVCPATIEVAETMQNVKTPWEAVRDEGKRGAHLNSVSLYAGHPREMGALVPDKIDDRKKQRTITWQLSMNGKTEYWISCDYSNTQRMLAQKVPQTAKICEVKGAVLNGKIRSFDSIRCE